MCLIVYSDLLPRMTHDAIMRTLESPVGQQADSLAEALFRTLMPDGRNVLEVLHKEGFMKKVQTSQVIMTPTVTSKIRLDELNSILSEMAKGEDAIKRLADIDNSTGLQNKKRNNSPKRDVGEPKKPAAPAIAPLQAGVNDVLSDEVIAANQIAQATRMKAEAKSLLAEADRLELEAAKLVPEVVKSTVTPEKRKPGRPKASVKNESTQETKKA